MTNLSVWDGTDEVPSTITHWDGAAEAAATARYVPYGRPISAMPGGDGGFFIAHRGGSADWAECSMRGYTQSAYLGMDGLEVSCARTSDGVWIGLHDQTINRTTPSAPANWIVAEHTYVELQAYQAERPSGGDPNFGQQPYAKLTDVLDTYAETHTILIDPKYAGTQAYWDELLGIIDVYPNSRRQVVGKYFCTGTSFGNYFRAAGYKTWGYYYTENVNAGLLATTHQAWDFLGIEHEATQAVWDQVLAYGKPVIGHIAANATQAQAAIDKGASGVMVSGVRSVTGTYRANL